MQKLTVMGVATALALVSVSACGGEDEPEGAPVPPGWSVPDDAVLGTLTDPQKEQTCKDVENYFKMSMVDTKEAICRTEGASTAGSLILTGTTSDAALQAACKTDYDACMAAPDWSCTPVSMDCKATLHELRACLDEATNLAGMGLQLLPPCDQLTLLKLLGLANTMVPKTPACTTLQMKCPELKIPIPELPGG